MTNTKTNETVNKITITLVKSTIGCNRKHINIVKQLGLKKMNSSVKQPDNLAIRGLINKVSYLLRVEESMPL